MLYNNKTTKLLNLQNFALRSSAEQTEKRLSEWIHIAGISLFAVFRYCTRMLKSWLDGIIRFFVSQLFTKSKKAPCVFRCTELFYHKIYINYRKKPKLLIIAGSFAFPEQIWKKEIIFITHKIICNIGNAIQPRIGIIITKTDRIETTVILRACLTWNIVYFDE